jgi:hypothetical protein
MRMILYRKENSLFDEMTSLVNQAFGNGKADVSNQLLCQCVIHILYTHSSH